MECGAAVWWCHFVWFDLIKLISQARCRVLRTAIDTTGVIEVDRISAAGSVMALKLPLKWLSARFRFLPTWFRPSFRYGRKWNLVSACRCRSTALQRIRGGSTTMRYTNPRLYFTLLLLSWLSLKRLRLCNMTAASSVSTFVRQMNDDDDDDNSFY